MWSPFHKRHPVGRARPSSDITSQCLRCSWDMCASLFDCWHLVGRARTPLVTLLRNARCAQGYAHAATGLPLTCDWRGFSARAPYLHSYLKNQKTRVRASRFRNN